MASIRNNTSSVGSSGRNPVAYGGARRPDKIPCLLCQKDFITRTPQGEYPHLNDCPDIPQELKPFAPNGENYQGINDFVVKMTTWIMKNKPESLNMQGGVPVPAMQSNASNSQSDALVVQQPQQQPYDPYAYRASWQPKQINCPFCETSFVAHVPEDQSFHLTRGCSDFPQHLKPFAFDGASYQDMPDFVNKMIAYLKENKPHLFRSKTTEQPLNPALFYGFEGSGGFDLQMFSPENINAYHALETGTAGGETASSHYQAPLAIASNRPSPVMIASSSAVQEIMPQQDSNNIFEFLVTMDEVENPVQAVHPQQDKQQGKEKSSEVS